MGRRVGVAVALLLAALTAGSESAASNHPVNSSPPTISGLAQQGETLTAFEGVWSGSPVSYTFRWERCASDLSSCLPVFVSVREGVLPDSSLPEPAAQYILTGADVGSRIRVFVEARNATSKGGAESAATAVVTEAGAPENVERPTITGTPQRGDTLTANAGTWAGARPIHYSYQWQRCTPAEYRQLVLGDAPTAYWRLGSTAGFDEVGNAYGGNFIGGVLTSQPGVPVGGGDLAATFDGVDDYLEIPYSTISFDSGDFTIEAWYATLAGGRGDIFSTGHPSATRFADLLLLDGGTHFDVNDGAAMVSLAIPGAGTNNGAWHHVVATRRLNTFTMYIDGSKVRQATTPLGDLDEPGNNIAVAAMGPLRINGGYPFRGTLDEVAVYKGRALDLGEIEEHHNSLSCADITGAIGQTYVLAAEDVSKRLRVRVTATNSPGIGVAYTATSGAVGDGAPANSAPPTVVGFVEIGGMLVADPGGWRGSQPISFTYQWQRCRPDCEDITGAVARSYVVSEADFFGEYRFRVRVTARNTNGEALAVSEVTAEPVVSPREWSISFDGLIESAPTPLWETAPPDLRASADAEVIVPNPGEPSLSLYGIIGADERQQVNARQYPYRAVARINYRDGGNCTGFFVGRDTIVTAGHCVYDDVDNDGTREWLHPVAIIPGMDDNGAPYGSCGWRRLYALVGWRRHNDDDHDLGAIKLSCTIGSRTGWFGYFSTPGTQTGNPASVTGYPGDKPQTNPPEPTSNQYRGEGSVRQSRTYVFLHLIDTTPGQSGSPFYQARSGDPPCDPCAAGVHAQFDEETSHNVATRITRERLNTISGWRDDD